jgi:hypothetical protein
VTESGHQNFIYQKLDPAQIEELKWTQESYLLNVRIHLAIIFQKADAQTNPHGLFGLLNLDYLTLGFAKI